MENGRAATTLEVCVNIQRKNSDTIVGIKELLVDILEKLRGVEPVKGSGSDDCEAPQGILNIHQHELQTEGYQLNDIETLVRELDGLL